jgi:hypothetical protein
VIAGLDDGVDLFCEADDTVIVVTTPTIDVVQLSHLFIEL